MATARLAIPLFGDEVAPRFCFADEFLVADVADGSVADTQRLSLGDASWPQRLAELAAAGVTVLLCGGFNRRFLPLAASHQIEVIWGLYGRADHLLQAFCDGALDGFQLRGGRRRGAGPPWAQAGAAGQPWRGSGRHGGRGPGRGRGRGRGRGSRGR